MAKIVCSLCGKPFVEGETVLVCDGGCHYYHQRCVEKFNRERGKSKS